MKSLFKELIAILKWRSRNIFIDPFYILYWDILPRLKRRKYPANSSTVDIQVKIPVTILTYKRPWYFEKTLKSFIKLNKSNINQFLIIILVQGGKDKDTEKIIKLYQNHIFKVIYTNTNLGTAAAYSILMGEAKKLNMPYILHLEDDYLSNESVSDFIPEIIKSLEADNSIGCIRLRSIKEKVKDYNEISRRKIKYTKISKNIAIGNAHFTFQPFFAKLSVINKVIPTSSEKDAMRKYQKLGLKTGQLLRECFSHIGHLRVEDWTE